MIRAAASAATPRATTPPTATPIGAAVFLSWHPVGCPSGGGLRRHPSCRRTTDHHPLRGGFIVLNKLTAINIR